MELMRLHVEALFTRDGAGRLLAVNDAAAASAPLFFLGRTVQGNAWWFRHDIGPAVAHELRALCKSLPADWSIERGAEDADAFIECLTREAPVQRLWSGPAYCFPRDLSAPSADAHVLDVTPENVDVLSPYLEGWRDDVARGVPMAVALESAKAVSICCSVRLHPQAHEAGVETHPDFRGRGHAARATAAWARLVLEMDRIPLYSTSWENGSSRALANKLGLAQYGADLHIT